MRELGSQNVWLVGGPELGRTFFKHDLVDKVCATIAPILLGTGVTLHGGAAHKLRLTEVTPFKNGMIDLWYDVVRPGS